MGLWSLGFRGCRVTPQGMGSPREASDGSRKVGHRERECEVRFCIIEQRMCVHKVGRPPHLVLTRWQGSCVLY